MTPFIPELVAANKSEDPAEAFRDWLNDHQDLQLVERVNDMTDIDPLTNPLIVKATRLRLHTKFQTSERMHIYAFNAPRDPKAKDPATRYNLATFNPFRTVDGSLERDLRKIFTNLNDPTMMHKVAFNFDDQDNTHRIEMNALSLLTVPELAEPNLRPSKQSVSLCDDLVTMKTRSYRPGSETIPIIDDVRNGRAHANLVQSYQILSQDKKDAIDYICEDDRKVKCLHGPPGTGKTRAVADLTVWTTCSEAPTERPADESDTPIGGPANKVEVHEYERLKAEGNLVPSTEEEQAKQGPSQRTAEGNRTMKVMISSTMNSNGDDIGDTVAKAAVRMKVAEIPIRNGKDLRIVRGYCTPNEISAVPRALAKIGYSIEPEDKDSNEVLHEVLVEIFDVVNKNKRRQRSPYALSSHVIDEINADRARSSETAKYPELIRHLDRLRENPEAWDELRKEVHNYLRDGPIAEVLRSTDVLIVTPAASADKIYKANFRPDLMIIDEAARMKPISTLVLIAHYTPLMYILVGDHLQNSPLLFSLHQHLVYKPPREFVSDKAGQVDTSAEDPVVDDWSLGQAQEVTGDDTNPSGPEEAQEMAVVQGTMHDQAGPDDESDNLPDPNTFGLQQRVSFFKAAILVNHPSAMLTRNFRHMTNNGDFFNEESYNGQITFSNIADGNKTPDARAIRQWIQTKVIPEDAKLRSGFSVMIDMDSRETVEARSVSNRVNATFAINIAGELLSVENFTGDIMIIAPYDSQRTVYDSQLANMGPIEVTRDGTPYNFEKSRVEVRTAQAAQGAQADVVIMDFTRSEKPGMTSQAEFINVVSSRAKIATVFLYNSTVFRSRRVSKEDPKHKSLSDLIYHHQSKGACFKLESKKYRTFCDYCHQPGHFSRECPSRNVNCPRCDRPGHPARRCRMKPRSKTGKAQAPEKADQPAPLVNQTQASLLKRQEYKKRREQVVNSHRNIRGARRGKQNHPAETSDVVPDTEAPSSPQWNNNPEGASGWGDGNAEGASGNGGWGSGTTGWNGGSTGWNGGDKSSGGDHAAADASNGW